MEPFPSALEFVFIRDDKTWSILIPFSLSKQEDEIVQDVLRNQRKAMGWTIFYLEKISPIACINHIESDSRDIYILDVMVEQDHVRCKDEVIESCPLKFDYEEPTIFDPSRVLVA